MVSSSKDVTLKDCIENYAEVENNCVEMKTVIAIVYSCDCSYN